VFFSSAVFGGIHLLNLLNPDSVLSWVIAQSVWASALGWMYAEIFLRTRSLYLPIVLHVGINGTASVWFHGLNDSNFTSALFGIPFFGVVPALFGILWCRLLARRT